MYKIEPVILGEYDLMNKLHKTALTTFITLMSFAPLSSKAQTDKSNLVCDEVAKNWTVQSSGDTLKSPVLDDKMQTVKSDSGIKVTYCHHWSYALGPHIVTVENTKYGTITFNDPNDSRKKDSDKNYKTSVSNSNGQKVKTALGRNEEGKEFLGEFTYEGHTLVGLSIVIAPELGKNAVVGHEKPIGGGDVPARE